VTLIPWITPNQSLREGLASLLRLKKVQVIEAKRASSGVENVQQDNGKVQAARILRYQIRRWQVRPPLDSSVATFLREFA